MSEQSSGALYARLLSYVRPYARVFALAVLAMLAIPGLQESAMRKQVSEALKLASIATAGVQLAYSLKGEMPANNAAAGIPEPDKIVGNQVKAVNVEAGAVTLTFGNNGGAGSSDTLFFTAGGADELHGLFGTLTPVPAELGEGDEE